MQIVTNGNVAINVHAEGPEGGPALVFSNSLGTDLRVWDDMLPHLPSGFRIVRYDKRGHGLSDCPDGPWSIEDHAGDLEAVLAALNVTRCVVVGLSVGGLIAQALYAKRPELIAGIVLMDTAAKIGNAEMWNQRIEAIEAGGIEALQGPILERWFTERFRSSDPSFAVWRNMLIRTPKYGYLRTASAIRDADYRGIAPAISVPVMAMVGDADGATPPALVQETAEMIPGARFELIADAGHLPCIEQPAITAKLIAAFVQGFGYV